MARAVRRLSAHAAEQAPPTRLWVRLSNRGGGQSLCGSFSTCQVWPLETSAWRSGVLPDAAAWFCSMTALSNVGARVLVDDAERHREAFVRHLDQHCRDAAVLRIVDEHRRIVAFDDLERQPLDVERDALGAVGEQHLLAGLQPQLLVGGDVALR